LAGIVPSEHKMLEIHENILIFLLFFCTFLLTIMILSGIIEKLLLSA